MRRGLQPASPAGLRKKAPPGRHCARGAWVGGPQAEASGGRPLPKRPPMLHQQQKPLGIKHSHGEGAASETLTDRRSPI